MNDVCAVKKHYSVSQWIHIAITLLLMFGFGYLPAFGGITPMGMKVLGVFLGVVYGYSACGDIIWPSLFAVIAYGLSGYTTMGEAITSMMGHNTVFQSIMVFIAGGALNRYGFGKWLVRKMLSAKAFEGRPLLFVWGFYVIMGIAAFPVGPIVLPLLLYPIWLDLAESCGYSKNSSFVYVGFGGILLTSIMGPAMISYTGWTLGLANVWGSVVGTPLNLGLMGAMTLPTLVLVMTLYLFVTKWLFKIDYSKLKGFDVEKLGDESKHLRPRTKRILVVYLLTILAVVLASALPGTAFGAFVNSKVTMAGMYCLCAAILLVLPSGEGDGKGCVIFNDIKNTTISWQVIFMCAVTLPVASAVTDDATGIVPFLSAVFAPLFEGRSAIVILIFTIIVMLFLTNVGSNVAFGAAMIPIIAPYVMATGMNPSVFGAALLFIANFGMVLPGASAPASIFHANEAIPSSSMRTKVTLIGALCLVVVTIPIFSVFLVIFG